MSCDEIILSVKNLSKRYEIYDKPVKRLWQMLFVGHKNFYREFWALKDINFEIRKGESWGIIGRNGAGKSTLLKIITGTLRATSGKVWKKQGLKIAALLELGSGFNQEFTGRENVYLNASILGLSRAETEKHYQEIIDFADIGDFIDQPVKKYSSGMKVRLAFAVQIMVKPDILIVDEALAVGDMFFQQKCMARMRKLREEGTTLLFVSHSLGAVRNLCDKAVYLTGGRVEMTGDAKYVCEAYQLSQMTKIAKDVKEICETKDQLRKTLTDCRYGDGKMIQIPYREDRSLEKRCSERRGSGEVKLMAADFYDDKGVRISSVDACQKICFSASFKVFQDVPAGGSVSLSCRDRLGNCVLGTKLPAYDIRLPAFKKNDRFTIQYQMRIPLLTGDFFWLVAIQPDVYDDVNRYDLCMGVTALRVVKPAGKYDYSYGYCLLKADIVEIMLQGKG